MLAQALKAMELFRELIPSRTIANKKPTIEILTTANILSAGFRLRIYSIMCMKKNYYNFCKYGEGDVKTSAILIQKRSTLRAILDTDQNPFRARRPAAAVMLFVSDFVESEAEKYKKLPKFVDVILVPTKIMKHQMQALVHCKVEVLFDAIDFNLSASRFLNKKNQSTKTLRVVWFGRVESYTKSMLPYESIIRKLVESGDIEFHIITGKNFYDFYKKDIFFNVHPYRLKTFPRYLSSFDVCIANHTPIDFSMSTYWKSENKAVLAINRGLPVVASKTPAYEHLLGNCKLSQYLFASPEDLESALLKLKNFSERKKYLSQSQPYVLKYYTSKSIANNWEFLYKRFCREYREKVLN